MEFEFQGTSEGGIPVSGNLRRWNSIFRESQKVEFYVTLEVRNDAGEARSEDRILDWPGS